MKIKADNIVLLINPADLLQKAWAEKDSKGHKHLLSRDWKPVDSLSDKDRKTLADTYKCGKGDLIDTLWKRAQPPAPKAKPAAAA